MKKLIFLLATGFSLSTYAQTPCIDGLAGAYPCENIDMLSFMSVDDIGGGQTNDVWGWVDPQSGAEYAILGRTNGTAFIDISDPLNPVYLGNLASNGASSIWRDIKVNNNHAYVVSEASGHGMQVFDLTQLADVTNPPVEFQADAIYTGFGKAHNIVINEDTDRAYAVGTSTFEGGLYIMDISNPINPILIGDFANDGYTHDAQVVNYAGPDPDYQGKEIAIACNENTVTIVDVSDPTDAYSISISSYSNSQYTHQGWLTPDHKFLLVGDELDEYYDGINTTTFIWDVQDLDNPSLIGTYVSTTAAIDHNLYTLGNWCFQSNYRAGLRIMSLENVSQGLLEEIAYFDVYPSSDANQFNGTWSNYPYFPSGVVAVSHIEEGIFFLQPTIVQQGCPPDFNGDLSVTTADLLILIAEYGCTDNCSTDLTSDDTVTVEDVLNFLTAFGTNC